MIDSGDSRKRPSLESFENDNAVDRAGAAFGKFRLARWLLIRYTRLRGDRRRSTDCNRITEVDHGCASKTGY